MGEREHAEQRTPSRLHMRQQKPTVNLHKLQVAAVARGPYDKGQPDEDRHARSHAKEAPRKKNGSQEPTSPQPASSRLWFVQQPANNLQGLPSPLPVRTGTNKYLNPWSSTKSGFNSPFQLLCVFSQVARWAS